MGLFARMALRGRRAADDARGENRPPNHGEPPAERATNTRVGAIDPDVFHSTMQQRVQQRAHLPAPPALEQRHIADGAPQPNRPRRRDGPTSKRTTIAHVAAVAPDTSQPHSALQQSGQQRAYLPTSPALEHRRSVDGAPQPNRPRRSRGAPTEPTAPPDPPPTKGSPRDAGSGTLTGLPSSRARIH